MPRKDARRGVLATSNDKSDNGVASAGALSAQNRNAFARYITRHREEVGLSQSELAARAGITRSLMSAIENGKIGLPSIDKRRALADALRVRHIDLLIAAGEIDADELEAGTPREFVKYPELQRDIESIPPDAAEALHDFMYFLLAKTPANAVVGFGRPAERAAWLEVYRTQRERLVGESE